MRITIWGVRGSIPSPGIDTAFYGGNTTCIEVRLADGTLIFFDCGSGLRGAGISLSKELCRRPFDAIFFLTHFHWDHVQGFPFFAPFYAQGNTFHFYSALGSPAHLRGALESQMGSPHFPMSAPSLKSIRDFRTLNRQPLEVGKAKISFAGLNHPQGSVAYRLEADGFVFVLATDTEPGSPPHDRALRDLAKGSDVLVYDAQYTPGQLKGEKKGWGHSSWLEGVRIAEACGVKRLLLSHHDPDRSDLDVDGLVQHARREFPNVEGAREGLRIELVREMASAASSEIAACQTPDKIKGRRAYGAAGNLRRPPYPAQIFR